MKKQQKIRLLKKLLYNTQVEYVCITDVYQAINSDISDPYSFNLYIINLDYIYSDLFNRGRPNNLSQVYKLEIIEYIERLENNNEQTTKNKKTSKIAKTSPNS